MWESPVAVNMSDPQLCLKAVQSAWGCVECCKHGKVQQVCGHHRNSMEGAGMHWSVPEYHKAGNAQGSGKC